MVVLMWFKNALQSLGGFAQFLSITFDYDYPAGFVIGGTQSGSTLWSHAHYTLADALTIALIPFLTLAFMLHLWHLCKLVF